MGPQILLLTLLAGASLHPTAAANSSIPITIPAGVEVKGEDSYVCITKALPDKELKLVGVEPLAEQEVVHHILLFGCDEPFAKPKEGQEAVWECKSQPTCSGRTEAILYGWGRNAPKLELPPGVGFSIGKGSGVKWIVMQLHYLKAKPAGDTSGVKLRVQDTPVPYSAGMLSYASWFTIPPRTPAHYVLNHCCYRGFQPLHTFAVRVHTHTMGRDVFMRRGDWDAPALAAGSGGPLVASGDPLKPQGFSPVAPRTLWPGERLTVGCVFDSSDKDAPVSAGADHTHEMCNMYLMVYSSVPHIEMCSDGQGLVDDTSPGNIPRAARLARDPFAGWKPPAPKERLGEGVVGNIASVALAPDGSVWVLTRGGRVWGQGSFTQDDRFTSDSPIDSDVVLQLHQDTGKVLRRWGAGLFYMPHMLTVDNNGSLWITDVGLHQALHFQPDGTLLRAVGTKLTPGHDHATLCKPTQVAPLLDGSFIVSDGYCNSRAVRYNPDGSFRSQYELPVKSGTDGAAAAPGSGGGAGMGVAHSLVVDECEGSVVVADREGKATHKFDLASHKLLATKSLAQHGKVWALTKGPYGRTLALCWEEGRPAVIADLDQPDATWALPDSANLWPHDFALGAAALPLTGAGDRLLAFYVAPLCEACGPLHKYVLLPNGFKPWTAAAAAAAQPQHRPHGKRPPLAHLGGHGHAAKAATAAAAAGAAAGGGDQQQQQGGAATLAELQKQLAELQRKVARATGGQAGDSDIEEYEVLRGSGGSSSPDSSSSRNGPQSWGSFVAVVSASVALGMLAGGVGLHVLHRKVLAPAKRFPPGGGGGGVGAGVRYSPTRAPRAGEDEDGDRLLNGNGHLQLSATAQQ